LYSGNTVGFAEALLVVMLRLRFTLPEKCYYCAKDGSTVGFAEALLVVMPRLRFTLPMCVE